MVVCSTTALINITTSENHPQTDAKQNGLDMLNLATVPLCVRARDVSGHLLATVSVRLQLTGAQIWESFFI